MREGYGISALMVGINEMENPFPRLLYWGWEAINFAFSDLIEAWKFQKLTKVFKLDGWKM